MNIQDEVAKIHAKYGMSEKANYEIQLLCEKYSEQQCDLIQELFTRPTKELTPLQDLWRKENPREKFTIPDQTAFFKWIREKILSTEYSRLTGDEVNGMILRMKDDSGREGCTYGDTDYDSMSVVYGYNFAIENVAKKLRSLKIKK